MNRRGLAYAALATLLFSTSPVLVRWAAPLPPVEITFWRMVVAAGTVWVMARLAGQRPGLARRDLPRFALFGLITALHFLLYIASLSFTTIAHALALVYTAPIFVTVFAAVFLGERIARRKYSGIAVAVVGVAILAGFEPALTPKMLLGDLLALGSAVCFGLYTVIGRGQRTQYPLLTYALGVYAGAALWLLPAAGLTWSGSYTWLGVVAVLALGVVPLGMGHTLYNAALRRLHPTYANLIATQEVTGGVLLGMLLLGEVPGVSTIAGGIVTLLGIALVLV